MGWTSYYVGKHFTTKDKQNELDKLFNWSETKDGKELRRVQVLKSSMVGNTYYAAARMTRDDGYDKTFAIITLTRMEDGEFFYKDMDESEGPWECKCPKGIFNLLSPIDESCGFSKDWRQRVLDYYASQKTSAKVKLGDVYECKSSYEMCWGSGYTIKANEPFFIKYTSWGNHKYFLLVSKDDNRYWKTNCKVTRNVFNNLDKKFVENIGE